MKYGPIHLINNFSKRSFALLNFPEYNLQASLLFAILINTMVLTIIWHFKLELQDSQVLIFKLRSNVKVIRAK